jgi:hypothetical protein
MNNFREPRLQDLLADPMIYILMKRDGVTLESLLALLAATAAQVSPDAHRVVSRKLGQEVQTHAADTRDESSRFRPIG